MRNNNTQREKILPFTVCNAYVQCKAWCSLFAVFVHISANSMTHHVAHNGAVYSKRCVGLTPIFLTPMNAPRRPSMVLLVGERSRSLANLLAGLPIPASDATSTTVKKCLRTYNGLGYVYPAPHKTGAGFDSLNDKAGSRYVSVQRFFCARNTTLTRIMAGRNGGVLALAGSFIASLSTLLRLATPFDSVVARLHESDKGAAIMAISTRLQGRTSSHLNPINKPLFVWRFFSCQQSTYHTVTATSEREARAQIPDAPCLFAARIRLEGVNHA